MGNRGPKPKFPCPFSPSRLNELYWREGMSLSEIAAEAARVAGWERVPNHRVTELWMQAAGIARRTLREAGKINAEAQQRAQKGIFAPEQIAKLGEYARERHQPILAGGKLIRPAPAGAGPKSASVRRKISKTKQAQRKPDYWFVGFCARCKKEVRRPRYRITNPERVFCSRACAGLSVYEQKLSDPARRRPCDYCGAMIDRRPSCYKTERVFCSKACSNKGRAGHK